MKKAFTLIELMVTVAIIGVLYSLAMPTYERQILKGRFDNEAVVTIKAIALAQEQYKLEVGTYYPFSFIESTEVMYNGKEINKKILVDLSSSNNFLYGIQYLDDGEGYTIFAILRKSNVWNNDRCDDVENSTRRCLQSTLVEDSWLSKYSRELSNHFISYTYPISGTTNINGINYSDIYTGN